MMHHHKYRLEELNNMMPYERQIYVSMLIEAVKDENERVRKQNAQFKK